MSKDNGRTPAFPDVQRPVFTHAASNSGLTPLTPVSTTPSNPPQPARKDAGSRDVLTGHAGDPPKAQPIDKPSVSGYGDPQTVERIVAHLCKEFDFLPQLSKTTLDTVVEMLKSRLSTSRMQEAVGTAITQDAAHIERTGTAPNAYSANPNPMSPENLQNGYVRLDPAKNGGCYGGPVGYVGGPAEASAPPVGRTPSHYHQVCTLQALAAEIVDKAPADSPSAEAILQVCLDMAVFLMEKNKAYGDSALKPLRVMSKAAPEELIRVRMDDKLSRLMRGEAAGEDAMKDLVGYWVLLQVLQNEKRGYQPSQEQG